MALHSSDAAGLYSQPVIVGTTEELDEALNGAVGPVGLAYIPRDRQVIIDRSTGSLTVADGVTPYDQLTPLPGGGSASFGDWMFGDGLDGAKTATDGEFEPGGMYSNYTIPEGVTVQVPPSGMV